MVIKNEQKSTQKTDAMCDLCQLEFKHGHFQTKMFQLHTENTNSYSKTPLECLDPVMFQPS